MDAQYGVTGAIVILILVVVVLRREHVWRRTPRRFWMIPIVSAVAIMFAVPASELENPSMSGSSLAVGLMVVGGLVGLGIGALRGTARFTRVGRDPDGRIA